jgi:dUTP pyrophosphatase
MNEIKYKKVSSTAKVPQQATSKSSGFDLYSDVNAVIYPNGWELVGTGIVAELPKEYVLLICPRSGLALKYGITVLNAPGVVDEDYRGEIKVLIVNYGTDWFHIFPGDRIAQALLVPITRVNWVEVNELTETERGEGGFGSTGV